MTRGVELETGSVLRVAFPAAYPDKVLLAEGVRFSSQDKAAGERTGQDPGLSVWDAQRITADRLVERARRLRNAQGRAHRADGVFAFDVVRVRSITDRSGRRPLTVRRDPTLDHEDDGGAHCGIFGLWRHPSIRLLEELLCECAELVGEFPAER